MEKLKKFWHITSFPGETVKTKCQLSYQFELHQKRCQRSQVLRNPQHWPNKVSVSCKLHSTCHCVVPRFFGFQICNPYLRRKGILMWRPALAAFLLASPIAAAASAAAAAADGLRVSLVCAGDRALWCDGFTLPGLKWAARASTSRIVALTFPSTISENNTKLSQLGQWKKSILLHLCALYSKHKWLKWTYESPSLRVLHLLDVIPRPEPPPHQCGLVYW